ncbi:MAG TPA: glycoside hydrolase family 3 N-terminal domain-containing protein [Candidatus Limnocylindrales bacterium]
MDQIRSRILVRVGGLVAVGTLAVGTLAVPRAASAATPSTGQLVGQKLMVAMSGTTPSASLLARIRAGQIGGVILFGSNVESAAQLVALTTSLRGAAVAGGQPRLLIATDQEGGSVRRLPWAAPTLSPPRMGALDDAATARAQGRRTGIDLACAGVDNDLAPVADVPASTSSFMYQQGRTWSFSASVTASMSAAFADGLVAGGDVPAMKHFPGIGRATHNTDTSVVTIDASKDVLDPGLEPYRRAITNGIPMIMLANATFTAYDAADAAGWSHAISVGLLRDTLGFSGVSITDSLSGTAAARGVTATSLAIKAAKAGTDMILVTGSESATAHTYDRLVEKATSGAIPRSTLETSYDRILALKSALPATVHDSTPPSVVPPDPHLSAGTRLGSSTVPVVTSWSASDGCDISRVELERSSDGGPWTRLSAGPTAGSTTESVERGSSLRNRVRFTDGAGNTGAWHAGPTVTPRVREQSSALITYHGDWTTIEKSSASNGSFRSSTSVGASATYGFDAAAIAWVASRGPGRGSAAVYVDGVYRTTIDLHASSYHARQIVYARHWSSNGHHTIRIVNLGTAGHPRIDVDAFVRLVDS